MGTNIPLSNHADEGYIDIEVSSSSSFFCYSISSPPQTREFEFQRSSAPNEREPTTSPADELFYKGKLLPLHLPPRLQMVQKLLQTSNTTFENTDPALARASCTESPFLTFNNTKEAFEDEHYYSFPFITSFTAPSTNSSTPFDQSCNISLSESCRVSSDLNPDEHVFEWSNELSGFIADNPQKSWSKKLKLVKQSLLIQKLKASRAYLKSLFSKTTRSDESSAKAASNAEEAGHVSQGKECLNKYMKVAKKSPFGEIRTRTYSTLAHNEMKSIDKRMIENGVSTHRKSYSGAIKCPCSTKSSSSSSSSSGASSLSSSFSISSSGLYELQCLKRSNSMNSEIESLIESAIAHCKQSQQLLSSSKTVRIAVSGG